MMAAAAADHARERRDRRVQAGHRVCDGVGEEHRRPVRPDRDQAGGGRGVVTEGHPLAPRAGPAVSGDAHPGQRRMPGEQLGRVDTELGQRPRSGRLDHHVGPADQPDEGRPALGRVQVQRDAVVAGMQQVEEHLRPGPRPVRTPDALDLHDAGPGEPQQMRAQGAGPQRRQVDDEDRFRRRDGSVAGPGRYAAGRYAADRYAVEEERGEREALATGAGLLVVGRGLRLCDLGHGQAEQLPLFDHTSGGQPGERGRDRIPWPHRMVLIVIITGDRQPRRQQVQVRSAGQVHRNPAVPGGQQAGGAAGRARSAAGQPADRGPFAEQRPGVHIHSLAACRREQPEHRHGAVQALHDRHVGRERCAVRRTRQRHGARSCPGQCRWRIHRRGRVDHVRRRVLGRLPVDDRRAEAMQQFPRGEPHPGAALCFLL